MIDSKSGALPDHWLHKPLVLMSQSPYFLRLHHVRPVESGLQLFWQLLLPLHPAYSFLRPLADFQRSLAVLRKATLSGSDFQFFRRFNCRHSPRRKVLSQFQMALIHKDTCKERASFSQMLRTGFFEAKASFVCGMLF